MEWSLGVEPWSGVLEWILSFVSLFGQVVFTDRHTATEWSGSDFGGNQYVASVL